MGPFAYHNITTNEWPIFYISQLTPNVIFHLIQLNTIIIHAIYENYVLKRVSIFSVNDFTWTESA